jgi:hypothetical protein
MVATAALRDGSRPTTKLYDQSNGTLNLHEIEPIPCEDGQREHIAS